MTTATRHPGLYDVTDDNPNRSARAREFLAPQGYGDELRAVFRTGQGTWGVVDLYRDRGRAAFDRKETAVLQAAAPRIAQALRTFATISAPAACPLDTPGTLLYDIAGVAAEPVGRDALTVPVTGDDALPAAVNRLHAAEIAVTELSLHLPSLDEVFMTLTGRPTDTDKEDAA